MQQLRFLLKDADLANPDRIEEGVSAVKGCFTHGGQFQVIIGISSLNNSNRFRYNCAGGGSDIDAKVGSVSMPKRSSD